MNPACPGYVRVCDLSKTRMSRCQQQPSQPYKLLSDSETTKTLYGAGVVSLNLFYCFDFIVAIFRLARRPSLTLVESKQEDW